ncbi:MAG: efflux RND transporter permease subunit [Armatimonadota bacterium]|nr:efflux RND transporter permease subunit [bacterium]
MWLTNVSIRRPIFIVMFVLALIVLGMQTKQKMPAEENPNIDIPYMGVITTYAGAGPNEIETLVSEPVEKAVMSVGNLRNVTSSSQDGISTVIMEFEMGTDLDAAAADVRDKVAAIESDLPEDAEKPIIRKADISSDPVVTIGLSGNVSSKEMRILADDVIVDRLSKVGGVAAVEVTGGDEREIAVDVDKDRLQAYGVGISKVVSTVAGANMNVPAGSIKEGARDYSVRTVGEFQSAEQVADARMFIEGRNGEPDAVVRIGDIAKVNDTIVEPDYLSRINGDPSVVITVQKQSDGNTVEISKGVREQLEEMRPLLPAGVEPTIINDAATTVEDSLEAVNKSLYEGILLVVIIVFLFLHTARATFIVAIAIPTSIVATFLPIGSFGFSLNTMTLLALSLVVGILVDDSIVVLENIERHLKMRKGREAAAVDGRSEIGLAAVAITMVDIVVFVPIAFMGGIIGQFFRQFGITVACATAFSLLMSFTLTPMLASRWMKTEDEKDRDDELSAKRIAEGRPTYKDRVDRVAGVLFGGLERGISAVTAAYRGVLEWALHNRFLTIVIGCVSLLVVFAMAMPIPGGKVAFTGPRVVIALVAVAACAAAMLIDKKSKKVAIIFGAMMVVIALTIYLPFGFGMFPDTDKGQFQIKVRTTPGTSLKATDVVTRKIEKVLDQVPEFRPVYEEVKGDNGKMERKLVQQGYYVSVVGTDSAGSHSGGNTGTNYAVISCKIVDKNLRKRGVQEVIDAVSARTASIPGAEQITAAISSDMGTQGVTKEVMGQNMDDILKQANQLAEVMKKTPGCMDVDISYKAGKPERRIIVDRLRAAKWDMTLAQVATTARIAIDGNDDAKLRDSGTEYPIRVRYANIDRNKPSDVENLIIGSKYGVPVYLKDVAQVTRDYSPTKIDRKNNQRLVKVTANLESGANLGNVEAAINQRMKDMPKVAGTTIATGGMGKMMNESFGYMFSAIILAIVLVYMLMGALFESFLTPLVIMFALPQAMIGALLALLVTGKSLSVVAMIGIIMLVGLVTKNAILLIDYTNTLRERGTNRHDALLGAGQTRLRPIMMTTLAMIGGMMPTALALDQGSEMRSPMAIAVIGGLIVSTLLTLIVIPVTYTIVDDAWQGLLKKIAPGSSRKDDLSGMGELDLDTDYVGAGNDLER